MIDAKLVLNLKLDENKRKEYGYWGCEILDDQDHIIARLTPECVEKLFKDADRQYDQQHKSINVGASATSIAS